MNSIIASVKREYWEHRNTIVGLPFVISALFIIAAVFAMLAIKYYAAENDGEDITSFSVMATFIGAAWLAGFYYLLSCLHADRKDKSILFWKSLPVSETQNVLIKFLVASVGFVAVSITFAWLTCSVLYILGVVANSMHIGQAGQDAGMQFSIAGVLLWPLASLLMGLIWGAPLFAYVLLVSAAAKRSPFLLLTLPLLGLMVLERILFEASHIIRFFAEHLPFSVFKPIKSGADIGTFLHYYFVENGLSLMLGLIVAAGFITLAIWFRNNKFET